MRFTAVSALLLEKLVTRELTVNARTMRAWIQTSRWCRARTCPRGRDTRDATDLFRESLQDDLSVNATDLAAMQHLLTTGPTAPTGLARRLGISTTATTTAIDRLVDLGHVTREPHPSDRRSILVVPSDTSRARAFDLLVPLLADLETVLAGFSDEEQAAITAYLERAAAVYRSHAERDQ